jgi:hypothetical protein
MHHFSSLQLVSDRDPHGAGQFTRYLHGFKHFLCPPPPHTHVKDPGGLHFRGRGERQGNRELREKNCKKEIISASKEKKQEKRTKKKRQHNDEGSLKWSIEKQATNKRLWRRCRQKVKYILKTFL